MPHDHISDCFNQYIEMLHLIEVKEAKLELESVIKNGTLGEIVRSLNNEIYSEYGTFKFSGPVTAKGFLKGDVSKLVVDYKSPDFEEIEHLFCESTKIYQVISEDELKEKGLIFQNYQYDTKENHFRRLSQKLLEQYMIQIIESEYADNHWKLKVLVLDGGDLGSRGLGKIMKEENVNSFLLEKYCE